MYSRKRLDWFLAPQPPFDLWMAIERKAWRPRRTQPPLRLVHMSEKSLRDGVEKHVVDGVPVHVFSAARTVADCFKFRSKIGSDVAVEALRAFRRHYLEALG